MLGARPAPPAAWLCRYRRVSAPGDPTITKWEPQVGGGRAGPAGWPPPRPHRSPRGDPTATKQHAPRAEPMFTCHPTITKLRGLLPREARANPGGEATLHKRPPPQPLPRGLAAPGQAGGSCRAPCPRPHACPAVGRCQQHPTTRGSPGTHPWWPVPTRRLAGRAPRPSRGYLGSSGAGELLHADCGAALLFWARGWPGPGR